MEAMEVGQSSTSLGNLDEDVSSDEELPKKGKVF